MKKVAKEQNDKTSNGKQYKMKSVKSRGRKAVLEITNKDPEKDADRFTKKSWHGWKVENFISNSKCKTEREKRRTKRLSMQFKGTVEKERHRYLNVHFKSLSSTTNHSFLSEYLFHFYYDQ